MKMHSGNRNIAQSNPIMLKGNKNRNLSSGINAH